MGWMPFVSGRFHSRPDDADGDARMNGLKLLEHIRNRGDQTPVLVISALKYGRYLKRCSLGVEDVLLKPVKDLNRLREMVFACLYPSMFNSRVEEELSRLGCNG